MKINLENKQDLGASTTDHIHAINQLKEKCREYNIPLCRLQNVNGGHSGILAFYFCPFWGACLQVTRACRQDYFLWSIFNYTEKSQR